MTIAQFKKASVVRKRLKEIDREMTLLNSDIRLLKKSVSRQGRPGSRPAAASERGYVVDLSEELESREVRSKPEPEEVELRTVVGAVHGRKPEIVADAAYEILTTDGCRLTGQTLVDEKLLLDRDYTDLERYAYDPAQADTLLPDFFLDAS